VLECEARRRDLDTLPLPEAALPAAAPAAPARTAFVLTGALLLLGAAAAWPLLHSLLISGLLAAAGAGALALAAAVRHEIPGSPATVERSTRAAVEAELEALRRQAEALATSFGFSDPDELIDSFRASIDSGIATDPLQRLQQELATCTEQLGAAREEGIRLLRDAGRSASARGLRRPLEALRQHLEQGRRLRDRESDLAVRADAARAEVAELESRATAVRARMVEILRLAGLSPTDGDDVARFAAAAEEAQRLRLLETELIPEAEAAVHPERWLRERRTERQTVEELLAKIRAQRPLEAYPEPEHSSNHYVGEFKRTDEELRQAQQARREALARAGDLLRQFREEGPRLQDERLKLESARRRADRFARAVALAADLLTGISRESYEEWATALNERSNRSLGYLNPEYRDLRFDTDLSFTLQEVATGRRLTRDQVDACLSSGARDQVYLAVRLAVSDYFSAGRLRLPLILDDVLATADDERFDRALTYLAERVSPRHQILILSCHEERHRRWQERHRDLFDARVVPVAIPVLQEHQA
jgi:DNA repair exonuclease SbcCD ATPase subunit